MPWAIANASYKQQKDNSNPTEIVEIPNRGHSSTIDSGWREVAEAALAFVRRFHRQPRTGVTTAPVRRVGTALNSALVVWSATLSAPGLSVFSHHLHRPAHHGGDGLVGGQRVADPFLERAAQCRTRCADAGVLRPGVTTEDLFLLSGSLSQAVLTTADTHPGQWRRLLRISLDGLSSRNTDPLPEPA